MAVLNGGALHVTDASTHSAEIANDCIGFMSMVWHAEDVGVFSVLDIADETPGGQFDFYFCSTKCLRAFFGACVDGLEAKVRKYEQKAAQ